METNALNMPHVEAVLHEYAETVRDLYKEKLVEADRLASEDLYNSVEAQVVVNGTEYLVQVRALDYWKYVEWDTKPHWPPVQSLLRWIRVKPVLPRSGGSVPRPEQLAYLIGRKIAREGTKGSHDLALASTETNRRFRDAITEALAQDAQQFVTVWIHQYMHI